MGTLINAQEESMCSRRERGGRRGRSAATEGRRVGEQEGQQVGYERDRERERKSNTLQTVLSDTFCKG